jgi:hypothetical protein
LITPNFFNDLRIIVFISHKVAEGARKNDPSHDETPA